MTALAGVVASLSVCEALGGHWLSAGGLLLAAAAGLWLRRAYSRDIAHDEAMAARSREEIHSARLRLA